MSKQDYQDITLLISSCKDYATLLPNFLVLFKKHFPDFNGYIVINTFFEKEKIKSIEKKYDKLNWANRTLKALSLVKTPFVIMLMDDFCLLKFDQDLFAKICNVIRQNNKIGYIKLFDHPEYLNRIKKQYFNNYLFDEGKSISCISLQAGLWKKSYLQKLLRKGESPWIFEEYGSYRSWFYRDLKLTLDSNSFPLMDYSGGLLVQGGLLNQKILSLYKDIDGVDCDNIYIHKTNHSKKRKNLFIRAINKIYRIIYLRLSIFLKIKYRQF